MATKYEIYSIKYVQATLKANKLQDIPCLTFYQGNHAPCKLETISVLEICSMATYANQILAIEEIKWALY